MPEIRAYLNELSVGTSTLSPADVAGLLNGFVTMMLAIRKVDNRAALVSESSFGQLYLTADEPLARLRNDARYREHFRFLLALRNVSPFPSLPELSDGVVDEYLCGGNACKALALAYLDDQIGVSFATSPFWNAPLVSVRRNWLDEDGEDGTDELVVRHAAASEHIDAHANFLCSRITAAVDTGATIWEAREQLFPHLDFLGRVEADLLALTPVSAASVLVRLRELEASSREWCDQLVDTPKWRSYVTSESATRRELCYFEDEGESRLFELHARYTPGPGRIHFRLGASRRRVRVAYVGRKLGI